VSLGKKALNVIASTFEWLDWAGTNRWEVAAWLEDQKFSFAVSWSRFH